MGEQQPTRQLALAKTDPHRDRRNGAPGGLDRCEVYDLIAEGSTLSACFLDAAALARVREILKPEHFYSDANARIFGAMIHVADAGTPVDITTIASYMRDRDLLRTVGGPGYLAQLADASPAVAHVAAHATTVFNKWRLRSAIDVAKRFAILGEKSDVGDLDAFLAAGAASLAEFNRPRAAAKMPRRLGEGMIEALESDYRRAAATGTLIQIRTGFTRLDAKIAGLHRGDLTIVAARPGMGKSALALEILRNVVAPPAGEVALFAEQADLAGAIFSLEMPTVQVQTRFVCADAFVDVGRRRAGALSSAEWDRCTASATRLADLPIWIDDASGISPADLRAKLRHVVDAWEKSAPPGGRPRRLGVVVVDYLQLMRFPGKTGEDEIGAISKALKEIAKEFDVPVIALAQLNRAVETRNAKDKRPQLSDLRGSGGQEQDADCVILLFRRAYYEPKNVEAKHVAELIIAKQRNGPTGKVIVRFDGHCTRFSDVAGDEPDDDDAPEGADE